MSNAEPDNSKYFSVFAREAACGDGVRSTDEICDVSPAGNTQWRYDYEDKAGRGYVCNSSCQSECPAIRACSDGQDANCCGNGILEPGEECELKENREAVGTTGASQCDPETCTEKERREGDRVKLKDSACNEPDIDCVADPVEGARLPVSVYESSRSVSLPRPDEDNAPPMPYVSDVADRHIVRLGGNAQKCSTSPLNSHLIQ